MVVDENMKIAPKKLGGIQFGINDWGREAAFVGLTFDRHDGFKDVSDEKAIWRITSPIDVLKELNNKNINEQLAILKKYVYIDGTIDNKYDLSIDINSSLANYSNRKDFCDYSLVLDKCKADDENGTLTLVVKEVNNFNNETTEETITFGNLFASKADANETSIFDNSLVFYKHLQCNKLASNVLAELSLITDEKEKLNKQLEYLENNDFIKTKKLDLTNYDYKLDLTKSNNQGSDNKSALDLMFFRKKETESKWQSQKVTFEGFYYPESQTLMESYLNGMINVNKWFINPSDPNEARQKASDILAKIKTKNNILEQFDVFRDDIVLKSKIIADQYDFKNYGTLNLVFESTDKNNGVKSSRVIDILNFYSQVQVGDFRLLPYGNTRATKSLLKANEIKDTLTKAKSPEER